VVSHLPYKNKLIYMLQTKLGLELPENIHKDIDYALHDYGKACSETERIEKLQWRKEAIGI
jgi:hypothetical protein